MNTTEYKEKALKLIRGHWGETPDLWHGLIGIAAESGEVLGVGKRSYSKGKPINRDDLIDELGDILWYIQVALASPEIEGSFEECMAKNIIKLEYRDAHGKNKEEERKLQKAFKL